MKNFFIKSLNGMAFGLFSSLIVGLILKQIGTLFNIEFLIYLGNFSQLLMGAGIGVGVAYALEAPVLILISSAITGMYGAGSINFVDGQAILKVGEPMGAYFSVIFGLLISKQIAGKTKFDIILLPITTIIFGCLLGKFFAPYISAIITKIGVIVNKTTELRPILMGLTLSVIMGIILTLPISSAAIGISLGLSGLAAGAALTGCCCQMIGFAIMSYDDNDLGTVFSIGFGSAILGVLSTTVFKLSSNSIASGMGTSGLVGQIASFSVNGMSYLPTMIILHFLLPTILTFIIYKILKKKGYIKVGDLKI